MPNDPHVQMTEEERRQRQAKARRRKKRKMQRYMLLGAMALAVVIIILVPILLFANCGGCGGASAPSSSSSASISSEPVPSVPQYSYPTAEDTDVWNLKLVNATFPLPDQFGMQEGTEDGQISSLLVKDGIPVDSGGNNHYYFDNRIIASLKQMIADCNSNTGNTLGILSGYRGWETQTSRYTEAYQALITQGMSQEEAAIMVERIEPGPGRNEHQIGLAADFGTATVQSQSADFASTAEYQWLVANAAQYGFIQRYTDDKSLITGKDAEPYHWRYVGVEDALKIAGSGICLEEYLRQLPDGYDDTLNASSTPNSVAGDAGASGSGYDNTGTLNQPDSLPVSSSGSENT